MQSSGRHIRGLPYARINESLSLGLTHGITHLSEMAIEHIHARHPNEYALCLRALQAVITAPDYIGQSPNHRDSFVVVKDVDGSMVLAAISAIVDEHGDYSIYSSYVIPRGTVHRRLRKGYFVRL